MKKQIGKLPPLTPRLRLIAERVPPGASFADIGTDHGYLPLWLLLRGRLRGCLASDLRPEPLRRARENARLYGAAGLRFRLCDGLSGIRPDEADCIAIAGMGGENIAAILDRAVWTADGKHTLLLQPMSRAEVLRRFLSEHGYKIQWEALARERGILYPVMEVTAGHETLSVGQWYGGAKLSRDPLGDRYLIETILRLQNAVAGLNRAVGADTRKQADINQQKVAENREKADELRDILTELLSMREEWRHANSGQIADNSTGSADRRGN